MSSFLTKLPPFNAKNFSVSGCREILRLHKVEYGEKDKKSQLVDYIESLRNSKQVSRYLWAPLSFDAGHYTSEGLKELLQLHDVEEKGNTDRASRLICVQANCTQEKDDTIHGNQYNGKTYGDLKNMLEKEGIRVPEDMHRDWLIHIIQENGIANNQRDSISEEDTSANNTSKNNSSREGPLGDLTVAADKLRHQEVLGDQLPNEIKRLKDTVRDLVVAVNSLQHQKVVEDELHNEIKRLEDTISRREDNITRLQDKIQDQRLRLRNIVCAACKEEHDYDKVLATYCCGRAVCTRCWDEWDERCTEKECEYW
jgi:hypothetical protein